MSCTRSSATARRSCCRNPRVQETFRMVESLDELADIGELVHLLADVDRPPAAAHR